MEGVHVKHTREPIDYRIERISHSENHSHTSSLPEYARLSSAIDLLNMLDEREEAKKALDSRMRAHCVIDDRVRHTQSNAFIVAPGQQTSCQEGSVVIEYKSCVLKADIR